MSNYTEPEKKPDDKGKSADPAREDLMENMRKFNEDSAKWKPYKPGYVGPYSDTRKV